MYEAILDFWFNEIKPAQWWKEDADFDQLITERYSDIHTQASRCELFEWRKTPQGRLAEIIVLDQFSRNMFRDTPQAFAYDPLALALAQEAVAIKADDALNQTERSFLYMPFMHSESFTNRFKRCIREKPALAIKILKHDIEKLLRDLVATHTETQS